MRAAFLILFSTMLIISCDNQQLLSGDECELKEYKTETCGPNGRGKESYWCDDGYWRIESYCDDNDRCEDNDIRQADCSFLCGKFESKCVLGQWVDDLSTCSCQVHGLKGEEKIRKVKSYFDEKGNIYIYTFAKFNNGSAGVISKYDLLVPYQIL